LYCSILICSKAVFLPSRNVLIIWSTLFFSASLYQIFIEFLVDCICHLINVCDKFNFLRLFSKRKQVASSAPVEYLRNQIYSFFISLNLGLSRALDLLKTIFLCKSSLRKVTIPLG
jgi:hypothetical protein